MARKTTPSSTTETAAHASPEVLAERERCLGIIKREVDRALERENATTITMINAVARIESAIATGKE